MKRSLDDMDRLGKVAFQLKAVPAELQKLAYAAKLSDVEVGTLDSSLLTFTKNISDTGKGIGRAKLAFKELGLDARALMEMPLTEKILTVSDALHKLGNEEDQAAAVMKIFGNPEMLGMLGKTREELKALIEERAKMPGLFDKPGELDKLNETNDSLDKMKVALVGLRDELTKKVAAPTGSLADFITKALAGINDPNAGTGAQKTMHAAFGPQPKILEERVPLNANLDQLVKDGRLLEADAKKLKAWRENLDVQLGAQLFGIGGSKGEFIPQDMLRNPSGNDALGAKLLALAKNPASVNPDNGSIRDKTIAPSRLIGGLLEDLRKPITGAMGDLSASITRGAEEGGKALRMTMEKSAEEMGRIIEVRTETERDIARVVDATRTDSERLAAELSRLDALKGKGLDDESFRRATLAARERFGPPAKLRGLRRLTGETEGREIPLLSAVASRTLTRGAEMSQQQKDAKTLIEEAKQARLISQRQLEVLERLDRKKPADTFGKD
jgi:hypothetical protein